MGHDTERARRKGQLFRWRTAIQKRDFPSHGQDFFTGLELTGFAGWHCQSEELLVQEKPHDIHMVLQRLIIMSVILAQVGFIRDHFHAAFATGSCMSAEELCHDQGLLAQEANRLRFLDTGHLVEEEILEWEGFNLTTGTAEVHQRELEDTGLCLVGESHLMATGLENLFTRFGEISPRPHCARHWNQEFENFVGLHPFLSSVLSFLRFRSELNDNDVIFLSLSVPFLVSFVAAVVSRRCRRVQWWIEKNLEAFQEDFGGQIRSLMLDVGQVEQSLRSKLNICGLQCKE